METITYLKNFISEQSTAVAVGKFDSLHVGHRFLLSKVVSESKKRGLIPAVVSIEGAGPEKSLLDPEEKEALLRELGIGIFVRLDLAIVRDLSPDEFLDSVLVSHLKAASLVCGDDFRFGKDRTGDVTYLRSAAVSRSIRLIVVRRKTVGSETVSSHAIREALASGNIEKANAFLGRNYAFSGVVSHGKQIGRSIGVPTANITPDDKRFLPSSGVYAVSVSVEGGEKETAIANLGSNPTVHGERVTLEIHLPERSEDLYGKHLTVELLAFLREERRFPDLASLHDQIETDLLSFRRWRKKNGFQK